MHAVRLLLLIGCGGRPPAPAPIVSGAPAAQAQPSAPMPLEQLYVLRFPDAETSDTLVPLTGGEQRTIVLRHAGAELDLFATLVVTPETFAAGVPVRLRLRQVPGEYALDVTADQPFLQQATLTFHYGRHFAMPDAAHPRYPTAREYERALAMAHRISETQAVLLPTSRPALDHAAAAILASGRYFLASPQ